MTPAEVMESIAALMNDTQRVTYTDEACLPYLNIAMQDLQEIFEQNNITYSNASSSAITVPAGVTTIARTGGPPQFPSNLIEIRQLWERPTGIDPYIPMTRKEYLPHNLEGTPISQFLMWAWLNDTIKVLPANQVIDLKMDYVANMFNLPISIDAINGVLPFENCKQFLSFRGASLCSIYIGENETRAQMLAQDANIALERVLGIWSKGKQSIITRRRPFRSGFKNRGGWWG